MEKYSYRTKGVCSTRMDFEIEGDIIIFTGHEWL